MDEFKKFPTTQYLGSKQKLIEWIINRTPKVDSILDAFSGSGVVSYYFKRKGVKVLSNDFLRSSFYYSKALIENNKTTLSKEDVNMLLSENKSKKNYVESNFADFFYTREECIFIDNLIANIEKLDDQYKRALALSCLIRTCIQKIPGGKFRRNLLKYRDKNFKHYRPKFIRDIKETFLSFVNKFNAAVFDNGKENKAYNDNIFDLIKNIKTDAIYFDPPYGGSGFDYEKDYFFIELIAKYYGQINEFFGKSKVYKDLQFSGFNKNHLLLESFDNLFSSAKHIPLWIISYNNRSLPKFEEFTDLIKKYKKISQVYEKEYHYKIGDSKGLKEYLFICVD